ncbi:MAG: CBS domain-containing protein, partial [Thermodesulfobacteriota bacterium]
PPSYELTILIQGFGAVGAHVANFLSLRLSEAKAVGISDKYGHLFDRKGLPIQKLFEMWSQKKDVTLEYLHREIAARGYRHTSHFSTNADNLLRESAFCMIPAAPIFNYLGVLQSEEASMTVNEMGDWSVIVEGANTYSPDPNRKAARTRMEQVVFRQKGVMIATDYLVNSGGVIFAAHEHILPTPDHLQIPPNLLGNSDEIERWLERHADEFTELSKNRLQAGEEYREKVIRRNMTELVDMLASNPGLLPCQAAERISLQRLNAKESERTAKEIMIPIPTIPVSGTVQDVSVLLMKKQMSIAAVLSPENKLVGVVTTWDITRAIADGTCNGTIEHMMTRNVFYARPQDSIIDIVRELEQHQISAMPIVDNGNVLGMVNTDLLAHRYLLPLLQSYEPL